MRQNITLDDLNEIKHLIINLEKKVEKLNEKITSIERISKDKIRLLKHSDLVCHIDSIYRNKMYDRKLENKKIIFNKTKSLIFESLNDFYMHFEKSNKN